MEPLGGIGAADALLGRPFPLPTAALPLARWVEVHQLGAGAEVEWNLDDSRAGAPGRLALYAGTADAPAQLDGHATDEDRDGDVAIRRVALDEAQASLKPVTELSWTADGLHLRLTAQGPWPVDALLALARSVRG